MILKMDSKIYLTENAKSMYMYFKTIVIVSSDLTSKYNGNEHTPNSTIVKILKIFAVMSIIHWRLLSEDVPILGSLRALTHYNNFH